MKYPIAKPYIRKEELAAVAKVLRSGVLSIGPEVVEFEKNFARRVGSKFACAVSSGTAGLHLALLAAGIKKGDEVITSPFSFIASANAILYVGAKPVFADVDLVTFNIDPEKIEKKINKKTKAILPVHIFGQAAEMKPILQLAKKYRLKIIEALCRSLRNQGRSGNMQWLDHERLGYNYRMDEMSAALGRVQLEKLDWLIAQKQRLASLYNKYLAPHVALVEIPKIAAGNTHSWFVYVVRINNPKVKRDAVIKDLEKKGVSTKAYLPSIHLFSFYKKEFKYKAGDFPISEAISRSSLALPFYIGLAEKDIKNIINWRHW